ncbi:MAG: cytochrome c/FTR1 family iron permease [Rhodanobacter sp.]|jgi:high-affinity iron transporter
MAAWLLLAIAPARALSLSAPGNDAVVQQTWQMLDYLATDYAGAVKDGAVTSPSEYAEMQEFAGTARQRLRSLPRDNGSATLLTQADALIDAIDARKPAPEVARMAHALGDALLQNYPVTTAPTQAPDLARGAMLYQQSCAACHGASGHGDGPAGRQLDPPPIDFTDQSRADQRSALSLYEVISQGVKGTAMTSYAMQLSTQDRWALAYYVGSLAYPAATATAAAAWQGDATTRQRIADLKDLSHVRVNALAETIGTEQARAIVGQLRRHPETLQTSSRGLELARSQLAASVKAYQSGNSSEATRLALSAYLDGVEPVEPVLNARDPELRVTVETAMGAYRTALSRQTPVGEIRDRAASIDALLQRAQLATTQSAGEPAAVFLGAFTILVREGLEALLVVVALLAFLGKAGRTAAVRYVHAGWTSALVAGGLTWAAASYVISISGAGRELTEGLSSLFAAAVLISVGLWMHQKSIGGRWQRYLKEKMTAALSRRSAWFLFALAFISVYREVFETILFYAALWNDGEHGWLLGGIAAGALVLGAVAWVLMRGSRRLPLATFFAASSALIAVLALVLTGKGVAALQEAGWVAVSPLPLPRIGLLGVYPTSQSMLAQALVLVLLILGFAWNLRQRRDRAGD